jgi:DNA polymerase (family 10)
VQNPDIARLFEEVADLLEIQGANPFRVRAYRNAARTILDLPDPLAEAVLEKADLTTIPGIGEDLAEKIATIVRTGGLPLHRQLVKQLSPGVLDLLRIPGLGPKRVKLLRSKLKVKSAADLAKALDAGSVAKLPGFGAKMVEGPCGLGRAARAERRLLLPKRRTPARSSSGSGGWRDRAHRRGRQLPAAARDRGRPGRPRHDRFARPGDRAVHPLRGRAAGAVRRRDARDGDVARRAAAGPAGGRARGLRSRPALLHGIQGPQRRAAPDGARPRVRSTSTDCSGACRAPPKDVYAKLKLAWIPPELREARGEIALAARRALPRLVELDDVRGDVQMHSDASDGVATVREMAEAARRLGYGYVAITDHSKRVSMSGLDAKALRAHWKAIDRLNAGADGFRILKSVEMDILESGTLTCRTTSSPRPTTSWRRSITA